jgi:hypothetical protein
LQVCLARQPPRRLDPLASDRPFHRCPLHLNCLPIGSLDYRIR